MKLYMKTTSDKYELPIAVADSTEWIDCNVSLPQQISEGCGKYSQMVVVELSDGTISQDWLINDKWTIHCKKNGGAYPVRWKNGNL